MKRKWTDEAAQTAWTTLRDDHLNLKQVTPLTVSELRASKDPNDQAVLKSILAKERAVLTERAENFCKNTFAWQIQKHPADTYIAKASGTLHLPLNLRQIHDTKQIKFQEGDDLNHIVFEFYNELAPAGYLSPNYVNQDALAPKRHEYLGPAPHIVDYEFSGNSRDCYVEWWDSYLNEKWVGNRHWANEAYFESTVHGWVLKPRGRFTVLLDDGYYCGCSE